MEKQTSVDLKFAVKGQRLVLPTCAYSVLAPRRGMACRFGGLYSDRPKAEWKNPTQIQDRGDFEKRSPRERGDLEKRSPRERGDLEKRSPCERRRGWFSKRREKRERSAERRSRSRSPRARRRRSHRSTSSEETECPSRTGRSSSCSKHGSSGSRSSCCSSSLYAVLESSDSGTPPPTSAHIADYCDQEYNEAVPRYKMEFNCELCRVSCSTFGALQAHFAGSKHGKKSKKAESESRVPYLKGKILRCLLCNVVLARAEMSYHVGCSSHVTAVEKAEERFRDMEPNKWFVEVKETLRPSHRYTCSLCNVSLTSYNLYESHIRGKRHMKAAKLFSSRDTAEPDAVQRYWCSICDIYCTDQETLDGHFKGKRHMKTLKHKGIVHRAAESDNEDKDTSPAVVKNPFMDDDALRRPTKIRCTLCDLVLFTNPEIQAHLTTTQHYMALRKAPDSTSKRDMFVAE